MNIFSEWGVWVSVWLWLYCCGVVLLSVICWRCKDWSQLMHTLVESSPTWSAQLQVQIPISCSLSFFYFAVLLIFHLLSLSLFTVSFSLPFSFIVYFIYPSFLLYAAASVCLAIYHVCLVFCSQISMQVLR